jgi:transposase
MRRITVQLSEDERQAVDAFRSKGMHHAREVNRAHILAALHQGVPDQQIRAVLGVSPMVIWRTRSAYQVQGLAFALADAPRSGAPRKYATAAAAEVSALACSPPPTGAKRWTIKLLVEAARRCPGLANVNRESLRLMLKKTF